MIKSLFIYLSRRTALSVVNSGNELAALKDLNVKIPFCLIENDNPSIKSGLEAADIPEALIVDDRISNEKFIDSLGAIEKHYDQIYLAHHTTGLKPDLSSASFRNKVLVNGIGHNKLDDPIYLTAVHFLKKRKDAAELAKDAFCGDPRFNLYSELFNADPMKPMTDEMRAAQAELKNYVRSSSRRN